MFEELEATDRLMRVEKLFMPAPAAMLNSCLPEARVTRYLVSSESSMYRYS